MRVTLRFWADGKDSLAFAELVTVGQKDTPTRRLHGLRREVGEVPKQIFQWLRKHDCDVFCVDTPFALMNSDFEHIAIAASHNPVFEDNMNERNARGHAWTASE